MPATLEVNRASVFVASFLRFNVCPDFAGEGREGRWTEEMLAPVTWCGGACQLDRGGVRIDIQVQDDLICHITARYILNVLCLQETGETKRGEDHNKWTCVGAICHSNAIFLISFVVPVPLFCLWWFITRTQISWQDEYHEPIANRSDWCSNICCVLFYREQRNCQSCVQRRFQLQVPWPWN